MPYCFLLLLWLYFWFLNAQSNMLFAQNINRTSFVGILCVFFGGRCCCSRGLTAKQKHLPFKTFKSIFHRFFPNLLMASKRKRGNYCRKPSEKKRQTPKTGHKMIHAHDGKMCVAIAHVSNKYRKHSALHIYESQINTTKLNRYINIDFDGATLITQRTYKYWLNHMCAGAEAPHGTLHEQYL